MAVPVFDCISESAYYSGEHKFRAVFHNLLLNSLWIVVFLPFLLITRLISSRRSADSIIKMAVSVFDCIYNFFSKAIAKLPRLPEMFLWRCIIIVATLQSQFNITDVYPGFWVAGTFIISSSELLQLWRRNDKCNQTPGQPSLLCYLHFFGSTRTIFLIRLVT
jgi:hypothetical protein